MWRVLAPATAVLLGLAAIVGGAFEPAAPQAEAASTIDAHLQVLVPSEVGWTPVNLAMLILVEPGDDPNEARSVAVRGMVERMPAGTIVSAASEPGTVQGAYILAGWKWAEGFASWSYNPEGEPDDEEGFLEALVRAAQTWAEADAKFEFVEGPPTALEPSLCEQGTRDGTNAIGWTDSLPGTTLAVTCTFPKSGPDASESDISFDASRNWTMTDSNGVIDFESVALHELGHVVGLGHSAQSAAVMTGTYKAGTLRRQLHTDDLAGLFNLYGAADTPTASPTPSPTPTPTPTPPIDPPLPLEQAPLFAPGLAAN
jgi:hypothetical protein